MNGRRMISTMKNSSRTIDHRVETNSEDKEAIVWRIL